MIYILLLVLTYLLIALNRQLLGIPGFFHYSGVRPFLKWYFRDKLKRVEEVYYWKMAESLGNQGQWSILPAYVLSFDLIDLKIFWLKVTVFMLVNYLWWLFCAASLVKKYIPQTPALRKHMARVSNH
ncbi:hypothetical protein [Thermoactinomyces mirandus]|uniref:Glycosyl-4,4'-diaponeurosporenoate acyltransferase n=1 Tax=Thermoactinomyces mirandus TaxID=2756294 RepID=A0A7W2AS77_9BACL|nr:hypothetical protein [Thermoactinomyces mirandus]MBA4602181.1 hypothetical protein [Thermoactinomyces mirandus]